MIYLREFGNERKREKKVDRRSEKHLEVERNRLQDKRGS